jgi:hypothetical protein
VSTVLTSGRVVSWGNSWLSGHVSLERCVEAIQDGADGHVVIGLPGETQELPLGWALGRARTLGVSHLRLALPVPGDPIGLGGPSSLTDEAIAIGEAVVLEGTAEPLGWVPEPDRRGSSYEGVRWRTLPARQPQPADLPSLTEAEHELADGVRHATEVLASLDVAHLTPEVADELRRLRAGGFATRGLAPGYPPRAYQVLERAQRLRGLVKLARLNEGAAVSASAMRARSDALTLVDHAARRAAMAAYNTLPQTPPQTLPEHH